MTTQGLPPSRGLPAHRRYAARSQLEKIAQKGRKQARGRVIAGLAIAVVLVGTGVSVAVLQSAPVTDKSTARCYTVANVGSGDSFSGTTVAAAGVPGSSAQVDNAVAVCSDLWHQGFLVSGATTIQRPAPATSASIPPLAACTLADGRAGVFPGDSSTCSNLGLPTAQ